MTRTAVSCRRTMLAASSLLALTLTAPAQAQTAPPAAAPRGIRLDHSAVRGQPIAPNTEQPGAPASPSTHVADGAELCAPAGPGGLPFSISVDGRPVDGDTARTESDRRRCVDVAADKADIQIKYDPLNTPLALNVWAAPGAARVGEPVAWRTYANYAWWLKRAEIRIFARGQTTIEKPLAILPVAVGGELSWMPPADAGELGYVLRVYDEKGRFDETALKTLKLLDERPPETAADRAQRDDLEGYGQSSLKVRNIPAQGGAVTVSGAQLKPGESVRALGQPVPVDGHGRFVVRQILPPGPHTVEVAVSEADGRTATFTRNLSIADKDFFYVALADLTAASGHTTGPAAIITGDTYDHQNHATFDGRAAFYLKGKILGRYLLTASADTREQPLKNLFSNFDQKDPNYLLRRIDPNRYYPVYGDDSTVVDDAPTRGKFYVRLERGASSVMWGDFQTSWTGTELTQYSRGLYGGQLIWNSDGSTRQGERRTDLEAFAAEPGTLASREEFRGTGGSLYYLHRQDLTEGSERVWVEVRDKDSGLVLQRTLLTPVQDYDVDYLQGRLTLRAPLPSTADGSTLVQTATLNGDPVYLIATYEYTPGLTAVHGSTVGLRATHWLTDSVRLGGTYYTQGDGGLDQTLKGLDAFLRYRPGTWFKGEVARSKGVGFDTLTSDTGGFDFNQNTSPNRSAGAFRLDGAVDLSELNRGWTGRLSAYAQQRDNGFSGPGLLTPGGDSLRQAGMSTVLPLGPRGELALKADDRHQAGQTAESEELAVRYKLNPAWGVSFGVRHDDYATGAAPTETAGSATVANASPSLSRNGERADAIVRLDYRPVAQIDASAPAPQGRGGGASPAATPLATGAVPSANDTSGPAASLLPSALASTTGVVSVIGDPTTAAGVAAARLPGYRYKPWNAYAFVQQTLQRSGERVDNDRAGVGGGWQATPRLRLAAEISDGDGGAAGKLGADYAVDSRSNLYLTYARETESPDLSYAGREGVLTAGGRTRLNDQLGLYVETRAASGQGPSSLTNAFGVDFAPARNWTTGAKFEVGRLSDPVSGDLKRVAVSLTVGYKTTDLKTLSLIEFRRDRGSSLGAVAGTCSTGDLSSAPCVAGAGTDNRDTLLLKENLSYQLNPSWRMLGTLNLSHSSSSQGAFYDGDYTEVVLGAAYRPVANDRWNALFKYTYFYNLPSSGQIDNLTGGVLDYTQRSHVFTVDAIYDLLPWLSVGAKYGLRIGDLRDSRTPAAGWFSSQAELIVLRSDIHFVREWDAVAELRRLDVRDAHDANAGALLAVYRHFGDHAKVGVGYNFTRFSDDLTDLSYRSRGVFLNALTTF